MKCMFEDKMFAQKHFMVPQNCTSSGQMSMCMYITAKYLYITEEDRQLFVNNTF